MQSSARLSSNNPINQDSHTASATLNGSRYHSFMGWHACQFEITIEKINEWMPDGTKKTSDNVFVATETSSNALSAFR